MNKAYSYTAFARAVNSSPQKQGHCTIKAAELRGQEGLMLQGGPKSDISAPWTCLHLLGSGKTQPRSLELQASYLKQTLKTPISRVPKHLQMLTYAP